MVWWCLWMATAVAAPVSLPSGEDGDAWARALAHAGVDSAEVGVELEDRGERWLLTVRAATGQTRSVEVEPARDADQREEVALLAASLLREVTRAATLPALPILSPPASTPAAEAPVETSGVRSPPAEAPEGGQAEVVTTPAVDVDTRVALVVTEPFGVAHREMLPTLAGPPEPPLVMRGARMVVPSPVAAVFEPPTESWQPFLRVGPGMALRARVRTAGALQLWGGAARPGARIGAGLEITAPTLLPIDDDSRVQATDAIVGAWLTPAWLEVGPLVAVSRRGISEDEAEPGWHAVGWLGSEVAVVVPVGTGQVRVSGRLARDLAPTELYVQGIRYRVLDPWHGGLWVSLGTGASGR